MEETLRRSTSSYLREAFAREQRSSLASLAAFGETGLPLHDLGKAARTRTRRFHIDGPERHAGPQPGVTVSATFAGLLSSHTYCPKQQVSDSELRVVRRSRARGEAGNVFRRQKLVKLVSSTSERVSNPILMIY
jgi:hypothetical protein